MPKKKSRTLYLGLFLVMLCCAWSSFAGRQNVTYNLDNGSGSLRNAIAAASAGDTVVFSVPANDTIRLKDSLCITRDMVILGKNQSTGRNMVVQVDTPGVSRFRVFSITVPQTGYVRISNLVMRGGRVSGNGGVISFSGTLTLDSVTVADGTAYCGAGGGIFFPSGRLIATNCTIVNNSSRSKDSIQDDFGFSSCGGGIYTNDGSIRITNSTISGNHANSVFSSVINFKYGTAKAAGGAIYDYMGPVVITNSTLSGNAANCAIANDSAKKTGADAQGGALYTYMSTIALCNCTATDNTAQAILEPNKPSMGMVNAEGGVLYSYEGKITITYCTMVQNSVKGRSGGFPNTQGAGIYCYDTSSVILNSICILNRTDNTGASINSDFYTYTDSGAYAAYSDIGGSTHLTFYNQFPGSSLQDKFGTSVLELGDHGGPTQTIPILSATSTLRGIGVRAGRFLRIAGKDTVQEPVWHNGTTWRMVRRNTPVPSGAQIEEITTDQRGVQRANPPCVGAFEYTAIASSVPAEAYIDKRLRILSVSSKTLRVSRDTQEDLHLEVFDLSGRLLFSKKITGSARVVTLSVPGVSSGAAVCRIAAGKERAMRKIIMAR
jgi:hypothetical protein